MSKVSYFYTIAVEMHLGEEGHLRGWIWDGRVIRDSDEHFSKLGDAASDLRSSPRLHIHAFAECGGGKKSKNGNLERIILFKIFNIKLFSLLNQRKKS